MLHNGILQGVYSGHLATSNAVHSKPDYLLMCQARVEICQQCILCPLTGSGYGVFKSDFTNRQMCFPTNHLDGLSVCRLLNQAVSPRSKKFKGPGGLPLPSPTADPGHLLTKLNGDAPKRCKRHEFSLDTCLGPTIFHRTKVCPPHVPILWGEDGVFQVLRVLNSGFVGAPTLTPVFHNTGLPACFAC